MAIIEKSLEKSVPLNEKKATQINPHKFPLITLHQFIFVHMRARASVATYASNATLSAIQQVLASHTFRTEGGNRLRFERVSESERDFPQQQQQ